MFAITSVNAFRGFGGHFGGMHRGTGIMLGSHVLKFGLLAILGFTAMALAIAGVSDWVDRQYPDNNFRQMAGWVVFVAALLVLGLFVTRVI